MKKYEYTNTMDYIFDATRSGSKYSMDNGNTWKNHGEWCESVAKFHRGLDYLVNPATSYDEGSDIEELNASVKSSNASLASVYGNSKEQIINKYFENVHSTLWIFVTNVGEEIIEYHMNAEEFRTFLENWATTAVESKTHFTKVRLKKVSGIMIKWLEEQVAQKKVKTFFYKPLDKIQVFLYNKDKIKKERKRKMTQREMMIYEQIVEQEIATAEEINLVTAINGMTEETLNDIIYARTGYHTLEQYFDAEEEDF